MGLGINLLEVLMFAAGLALLYCTGRLLLAPLRFLLKLIASSLLGWTVLLLINAVGGIFSVTIAVNPLSAFIAGYFGLPGVILLLVLKLVLP